MTQRIGNPDTNADIQLRGCLDERPLRSFVMIAGAGSGKTTSLVKGLDHIRVSVGSQLKLRSQQIACITYTDVAVKEILSDVENASIFHVSTIHSFLWAVVKPFQNDIRSWIATRINEKIVDANDKISNPRVRQNTKDRLLLDLPRYQTQLLRIREIKNFKYGTGSDYGNGILGHDDILKIGPSLITSQPLLKTIIANRFPYIFVDESQDTNPTIIEALKSIELSNRGRFCLGFFGDPMQKIYTTGMGTIVTEDAWATITKPENFRCPTSILNVINRIRSEDDELEQTQGRQAQEGGITVPVVGSARLFILPADNHREERLRNVRSWLAVNNNDEVWASETENGIRLLVLVHRMAAIRLGFGDIYSSLNDYGSSRLKDGLLDGTAWVLKPLLKFVLPLVNAAIELKEFEVISFLRKNCIQFQIDYLRGNDVAEVLQQLQDNVRVLIEMLSPDSTATIREVFDYLLEVNILEIDDRLLPFLQNEDLTEDLGVDAASINMFLSVPAKQLWGYQKYIEELSVFSTQQGVKGSEFERVLVVLDDEESDYNLFSYGKYFGITALSDTDNQNILEGVDSAVSRTRRLFYVCCSRATKDLAVAWYVHDLEEARTAAIEKRIFNEEDIYVLN